ncbi:MAG: formate dehydrogenase subunit alpha [Dehalococcoidia bacterium]
MTDVTLRIDGHTIKAKEGATILEAATAAGIYIPNLCAYAGLKPLAQEVPDMACQMCLVDVDGAIVLSCATPVSEGMSVKTNTPAIQDQRRKNLTALLRRHPSLYYNHDEVCPKDGNCELQKVIDYVNPERLSGYTPKNLPIREDSPFFVRDNNLCIGCQRCVRVCEEVRGISAIKFAYPCKEACPAGIDIPRYIRLIGRGRADAALAVIREKVPFPGVLGRVCVHPCEEACQRGKEVDKPLGIRILKRFASDNGSDVWKEQSRSLPPTGKSVAVVGSGPAGLTAAYYLAKKGHGVTVFEALPEAGGMMRVGIPEYRLPRDILAGEIDEIEKASVEIKLNSLIESLDQLFDQGYNAAFLGIGCHEGMGLGIEGENLPGVVESADFLRRVNLGEKIDVGEHVGVIGGGNVAIDAARVSLRLGAKTVTIFYRRTREEMPANPEEIDAALEENVQITYLVAPSKLSQEKDKLQLECTRMELGEPDASGRRRPVPIEGSEFTTELDTVIGAIGQQPSVPKGFNLDLGRKNVIKANDNLQTSQEEVFSGGDCVSGPATVIEAIAAGRKGAEAIDRYLGGDGDISESLVPPEEATFWQEGSLPEEQEATLPDAPVKTRVKNFEEVEQGLDEASAIAESTRCLQCHLVTPVDDKSLRDANCEFCAACVDSCPTGALTERSAQWKGTPDRVVTTICPYCGVGCQLKLEIKDEQIMRVVPDPLGPANKGQACVKGKSGMDFVWDPGRLNSPLIKKDGEFVVATWDEALSLISTKLNQYKGDSFAAISSAKCTNEENYLLQKFARAGMGTNNVDHCARLCHASTVAGLAAAFGSGAMTNSIEELPDAGCIFAIGTNTTENHPVIGLEVKKAVQKGGKLIVANPRHINLCDIAHIWLRHHPGTDVALLMGMAKVIVDQGLLDKEFIEERCEGFEEFKEALEGFHLDRVSEITGVPMRDIAEAAQIYATSHPASILYSMGITQHSHGTDNVLATANIAMLTGNVGKWASGVNPLRGQNNVQGACDLGALPNVYTGYQAVTNSSIRKKFEEAWNCILPGEPGLPLTEMFNAIEGGKIKAMYLMGENPMLSDPDITHIKTALEKLEFLVVQDIFPTETAKLADVVLPGTTFAEKDGTFTNTERRAQRVRKALEPVGNSRPDWKIICDIANKMGIEGFGFSDPSEIMEEIADLTPSYGGITYSRLEIGGLQWPCPTDDYPGTRFLHEGIFARGKGKFSPLEYKPSAEQPDSDFPLLLTTGRELYHFHTGTMTRKAAGLNDLRPDGVVEINPADAEKLGITDGDTVKVSSRRGMIHARASITEDSPAGLTFMTFHFAESPANMLTNPVLDPVAKIPELKVSAVKIEK